MKVLLILLGIVVIGFIIIQLFALKGQRGIEVYPYSTLKEYDDFEIRSYEASLFTAVQMSSQVIIMLPLKVRGLKQSGMRLKR